MIALPPPASEQCVDAESPAGKTVKAIWEVTGSPAAIGDLLLATKPAKWADILVDEVSGPKRHIVFRAKADAPYRRIGAFIYRAQSAHVVFTSRFDPPICGMDQN